MPSPILARADALMQRRHLNTNDHEEVPVLTDAIDVDDEIPVLVDIDPSPASSTTAVEPEDCGTGLTQQDSTAEINDETPDHELIEALGQRIEQRLQAEIPRIVAACVAELIEQRQATRPHSND